MVNQLRLYGKPRRGWIGAQVQSVTPDIALVLNLPAQSGAVVATVAPGSPAAAAHLRPGDVILTYDGHAGAGHEGASADGGGKPGGSECRDRLLA